MSDPAPDLAEDARLAADLVRAAGTLARRMRSEGLETDYKTSISDVVTAADRAAEELVTGRLRAERPGDAVLGEEHGHVAAGTNGRSWVVDPVDGTYNFVNDLPWWCSAVGLRDTEDLLVGAVHDPLGDATYVGGPGLPSTCDGGPLAPLADRPLTEIGVATYLHPPFLEGEVGAAWRRAAGGAAALRWLGSMSMDQVGVATGRIGLVFQHSVAPWDELPGAAIIRGVGGVTRHVEVAGKDWYVAGPPTAVAEVCSRLLDR
ncbi:inositol monophosphatase [Nocardioides sp. Arc9.136]|uniref:inositol monophosphatase family protein n=1 Tax=Nocardioides sp. Arc9.136 TaxID=2996826 RepID=UPI0026667DD4|nr:inositol monophosphatase [Nocardioides sp. Arc9.136]WKN46850.1 inositol monophosphatase [Nocardioides sp. Arc9.136]